MNENTLGWVYQGDEAHEFIIIVDVLYIRIEKLYLSLIRTHVYNALIFFSIARLVLESLAYNFLYSQYLLLLLT